MEANAVLATKGKGFPLLGTGHQPSQGGGEGMDPLYVTGSSVSGATATISNVHPGHC